MLDSTKLIARGGLSSVVDPGFRKVGAPTYYLTNFPPKLHENKEILARVGRVPYVPGLDSSLIIQKASHGVFWHKSFIF